MNHEFDLSTRSPSNRALKGKGRSARFALKRVLPWLAQIATAACTYGCGCQWGSDVSEVTTSPAMSCLELHARGSCADVELSGTNHCHEPLLLVSLRQTVEAGEHFKVKIGRGYVVAEDGDRCVDHFELPSQLGNELVYIRFGVEAVNRGG